MSKLVVHQTSSLPFYQGPHEIPGIRFRSARAALGVTAWGMNVLDLAPHCTGYPEHDHTADGQEEVYLVLSGAATLHADGQEQPMTQGDLVRVPPEVTRKFVTGDSPVVLLALGGTPGAAYAPSPGM